MQAVNVIGLMDHIDEAITVLGESGVFHPDEVSAFYSNIADFTHLQTNNIYAEPLTNLRASLNLTGRSFPLVDTSDFSTSFEELESYASNVTKDVDALTDKTAQCENALKDAREQFSVANHFKGLGVQINKMTNMRFLKARFGRLPKDSFEKLEAYKDNEFVNFALCTEDKAYCWGAYFVPREGYYGMSGYNNKPDEARIAQEVDRVFEGLYFERFRLEDSDETPDETIAKYEKLIPKLEQDVRDAKAELNRYLDLNSGQITRCLSKLEELYLYAGIRSKALQYNNSFIIVGWVPKENAKSLKRRLRKIKSIELDFSDASEELSKSPPVKLKNCFLAKPFEFYTEMYGVPKYNEIDPTLFIAVTYILIFGVMFADLGQGIMLSIVGALMWKLKKLKIGKVLLPCGISSAIFGTIFGSFFGFEHFLDPMFRLFGFAEKPIDVMDSKNINTIILTAIALGVILLLVAMCLNVYSSIRQKNLGQALFSHNGVAGIVFYGALVFGFAGQIFLGWNILTLPYVLGLIVLPFLLIFFCEPLGGLVNREKDWQPESWGGYITEKFFESIEVLLSYVTNTMSFLRVGAFVLVHAGMMIVVFVLAETAGGVGYWVILVLGNALVMALEALLVAIQALRLEYYELFSRFYTGEGRAYEPVKLMTD